MRNIYYILIYIVRVGENILFGFNFEKVMKTFMYVLSQVFKKILCVTFLTKFQDRIKL